MRIAIDMDGVLCDFVEKANQRVWEHWQIVINTKDIESHSYAEMVQKAGVKLSKQEIYTAIMGPGLFRDLKPLPGAIAAVKQLVTDGHEITILTKVLVTDRDSLGKRIASDHGVAEKLDWLADHLGDTPYSVMMISKMTDKHLVNAHVIVDDDPRVLEHPTAITICMAQPWNKKYRSDLAGMQTTIFHMSELVETIEFAEGVLKTKDRLEEDIFAQMEEEVGINESTAIRSGSGNSSN